jgi:RNA polymerase sigma-70 factor (ECF subfamily)
MQTIEWHTFQALKRGNHEAFHEVYQQFRSLLYVIILSIVKHEPTAEDLLQDTFLKIYQKVSTLKDPDKFQAWASMIAKHTALNELKRKKEEVWQEQYDQTSSEEDGKSLFQTWHKHLSDQENLVIAYKIVYELGFEDISKLMDISLSNVHHLYEQALDKLKVMYRKQR